jgi:hypothetical protein
MQWKLKACFVIVCCVLSNAQEKASDSHVAKTAAISGTVTSSDTHLPLKNVQIAAFRGAKPGASADSDEVEDESAADRQFSTKTDEKGNFELPSLAPGTYYVKAAYPGMVMKGGRSAERMLLNLESGQQQKLSLTMLPAAVITGRVLNEEGEPMQHVAVGAMRYVYTIHGRHLASTGSPVATDDKGEYRLFGLQPGSYIIAADPARQALTDGAGFATNTTPGAASAKPNMTVYVATYYPNEISPAQATPIVLKAGDETQANFSLTRVPAHSISGTITGLSTPKAGDNEEEKHYRFVMAMKEGSPSPAGMTPVSKDSSFKIGAVPAGKYKIVAMEAGSESGSYGYKEVTVSATDVTGVVISVNSAGTSHITGVVRAESEAKLDYSKLYVVLAPFSGEQTESPDATDAYAFVYRSGGGYAEVKKDGSFKLDVAPSPSPYQVLLSAQGGGFEDWFTSKVLIGGKDVLDSGFKAGEAQRGAMEIIISNKGGALEGNVLDAQQKPFSNAEIIALPADPKLRRRYDLLQQTVADQQGHFKIRGMRPGEYIVLALENSQSQPFTTEPFLKANSGKVQTVKLEEGAKQKVELLVIPAEAQ